ncbi:MAG: hypothetical protein OJF47_003620 [Nitrospira sp.]|jgi:hypothetical protein|nr:MAG: hypothetical protein OJF47_003620 [Nitrospira sp.]
MGEWHVSAQRAGQGKKVARSGGHNNRLASLNAGQGRSECYEMYRLRRDAKVVRFSGLQVQRVKTRQPIFLSVLCCFASRHLFFPILFSAVGALILSTTSVYIEYS